MASPLEDGWYRTVLICWMPLALTKPVNLLLVNDEPLSVTRISGRPELENVNCDFSMVTAVVEVLVMCTLDYMEWKSITSKNIFPRNGLVWSSCTLDHGFFGHSHGYRTVGGGSGPEAAHVRNSSLWLQYCNRSLVITHTSGLKSSCRIYLWSRSTSKTLD